jgi:hypothetical protein
MRTRTTRTAAASEMTQRGLVMTAASVQSVMGAAGARWHHVDCAGADTRDVAWSSRHACSSKAEPMSLRSNSASQTDSQSVSQTEGQ